MSDIEERLRAIEERNGRVALDKAWEVSWTRRCFIMGTIYIFTFILLNILKHEGASKHALVPVLGYLVSTLSIPPLKALWIKHITEKKA